MDVFLTVFEDNNGNLYYNHTMKGEGKTNSSPSIQPSASVSEGLGSASSEEFKQSIPEKRDSFNMEIRPRESITPCGSIELNRESGETVIRLFMHRNASMFLHEMGHMLPNDLLQDAREEGASERIQSDSWARRPCFPMYRRWGVCMPLSPFSFAGVLAAPPP